ncbi:MAG: hypothetical protein RBR05_04900 [Candidatus Methanomethylophilaceae archaeon]|nr:hypothetical protein [Candidatus Methanomethylophilaceae archaeon]MDY0224715.1 hypothetical protein [Candidatus Methanomethylophilaceae archaeon]
MSWLDSSKYTEYGKKVPYSLILAGPIVFIFATYYFVRVFEYLHIAFDYFSAGNSLFIFVYMLFLFALYINYLWTIFMMATGNRRAWGRMIRQSCLYIVILILNEIGINYMTGDVFSFGPMLMAIILVGMIALMMTYPVRSFFTPRYSKELPLRNWLPYIFWIDPFNCKKIEIM